MDKNRLLNAILMTAIITATAVVAAVLTNLMFKLWPWLPLVVWLPVSLVALTRIYYRSFGKSDDIEELAAEIERMLANDERFVTSAYSRGRADAERDILALIEGQPTSNQDGED